MSFFIDKDNKIKEVATVTFFIDDDGRKKEYITLEGLNKYHTVGPDGPRAILFVIDDVDHWVPASVVEDWPAHMQYGEILVEKWFAEKEGLV